MFALYVVCCYIERHSLGCGITLNFIVLSGIVLSITMLMVIISRMFVISVINVVSLYSYSAERRYGVMLSIIMPYVVKVPLGCAIIPSIIRLNVVMQSVISVKSSNAVNH